MSKIVLIGGGNIGRGNTPYETKEIDEEIVKMTTKEHPNLLFVGLASSFSDSYYDTVKLIYKDLGCNCAYLKKKNIINNRDIVENKINTADIIYFCGGDTIKLVDTLKEYDLIPLLQKAIDSDKVIVGMSAGAIMLCKEGYSDSLKLRNESDKYCFIDGLNYLDISFCPHYENESDRASELKEDLKGQTKKVLCLPNGVAMAIENDKKHFIKSLNNDAYLCYYDDKNIYHEEKIEV